MSEYRTESEKDKRSTWELIRNFIPWGSEFWLGVSKKERQGYKDSLSAAERKFRDLVRTEGKKIVAQQEFSPSDITNFLSMGLGVAHYNWVVDRYDKVNGPVLHRGALGELEEAVETVAVSQQRGLSLQPHLRTGDWSGVNYPQSKTESLKRTVGTIIWATRYLFPAGKNEKRIVYSVRVGGGGRPSQDIDVTLDQVGETLSQVISTHSAHME